MRGGTERHLYIGKSKEGGERVGEGGEVVEEREGGGEGVVLFEVRDARRGRRDERAAAAIPGLFSSVEVL